MNNEEKHLVPPYGPTGGMLQGLELMQRITPAKVNVNLLRANKVAPGNEYKVVGALRFLGLIDDDGRPTEKSRLLKTRGPSYKLALQEIVRTAYSGLFEQLDLRNTSRDQVHNYFVTREGLGMEMAAKATRFLVGLCQQAEIELGPDLTSEKEGLLAAKAKASPKGRPSRRKAAPEARTRPKRGVPDLSPTLVLAITPETVEMGLDQLTELFRKIKVAMERASSEE